MTKREIVEQVEQRTNLSFNDVHFCLNTIFDVIRERLASGEKISIRDFGTFETRNRKAHVGRNPMNGKEIEIPASRTVHFTPGNILKKYIQDGKTDTKTET